METFKVQATDEKARGLFLAMMSDAYGGRFGSVLITEVSRITKTEDGVEFEVTGTLSKE